MPPLRCCINKNVFGTENTKNACCAAAIIWITKQSECFDNPTADKSGDLELKPLFHNAEMDFHLWFCGYVFSFDIFFNQVTHKVIEFFVYRFNS
jgi:hypothetical protein